MDRFERICTKIMAAEAVVSIALIGAAMKLGRDYDKAVGKAQDTVVEPLLSRVYGSKRVSKGMQYWDDHIG